MSKKYYACKWIARELDLMIYGVGRKKVKLSWADGMFGAVPVFTNRKRAEKYCGKNSIITFLEVEDEK